MGYLGISRFIKIVDFLVLFWTMRRCLATRCVPFMTSFSHSYVLGGSQHAIPNFLGRLPFVWVLLCLDVSRLRLPTVWAVEQDGSDRLCEVFGFLPLHQARGFFGIILDYEALVGNMVCALHNFI